MLLSGNIVLVVNFFKEAFLKSAHYSDNFLIPIISDLF